MVVKMDLRSAPRVLLPALAAALALVFLLRYSTPAIAQTPPPIPPAQETVPTEDGLGECDATMRVGVLNDDFNTLPEDLVKREGNGGFEAFIVTNCIPAWISWYVVDDVGLTVHSAEAPIDVRDAFDDVEWLDLADIQYERYASDVVIDGETVHRAGDMVLDDNGNAIPLPSDDKEATAYRYKLVFENKKRLMPDGTERRPLVADRDYGLIYQITPFDGAPPAYIHEFTFEVIAKIGGQWWNKLLRIFTPTYWIEQAGNFVFSGAAQAIMGGMCSITTRFMTNGERMALDRYDSDGDGRITELDAFVEHAEDPGKPNGNGNCKRPTSTPEEELEEIRTAAYREVNHNRALAGLPPLERKENTGYVRDLLDGRDSRDEASPAGSSVGDGLEHLTLAPRVGLSLAGAAPPQQVTGGGITTFTGLLTGTPPELTYERGIVRLGWSAMMNVMVAVLVLVIAWMAFSQIIRSFIGAQRNMADWRELLPRLALAILAALTSYWWCSLLVDVSDGVSRYVAATMRVTPADITLTLGQAVLAVVVRGAGTYALSFVPFAGWLALAMKLLVNFLIVTLMLVYAMFLLLIIGQFVLRIVLINLLIIVSPIAMIVWAVPETSGWGKRWSSQFAIALVTQSLQLICFALATWFIREATPIGVVFDTGTFPSALQSLLPTQMIWALALGCMAAYLTTKIPSMLGSSIYEGFQSAFMMAAVGALALTTGGLGGAGGSRMFAFLGGGGGGGGAAAGGIASNLPGPARGVVAALRYGDTASQAVMRAGVRGGSSLMTNAITGVRSVMAARSQAAAAPASGAAMSPAAGARAAAQGVQASAGTPGASPSSAAASAVPGAGAGQGTARPTVYLPNGNVAGEGSGASGADADGQSGRPTVYLPSGQAHGSPPAGAQSQIHLPGGRVVSTSATGASGQGGAQPSQSGAQPSQGAVQASQGATAGSLVLPSGAPASGTAEVSGIRHLYMPSGARRLISQPATAQEGATRPGASQPGSTQPAAVQSGAAELAVSQPGVPVSGARGASHVRVSVSPGIGGRSSSASQTRAQAHTAQQAIMGQTPAARHTAAQPIVQTPAPTQPYFVRSSQISSASPASAGGDTRDDEEQSAGAPPAIYLPSGQPHSSAPADVSSPVVIHLPAGGQRVISSAPAGSQSQASPTPQAAPAPAPVAATEAAQAGELGEAALRQEEARPATIRQTITQAAVQGRTSFMGSLREGMAGSTVRQVRNITTGRVSDETADGLRAREILGAEEFGHTAVRSVKADSEGTWINEGGNIRNMQYGRDGGALREVRAAMNDDASFRRLMENDIKLSDSIDSRTGVPYVIENQSETDSGYRAATEQESAAIRTAGRNAFEEAGAGRREFLGDGLLVRDNDVRRMASDRETELYDTFGQQRFNDVMSRRVEDAGERESGQAGVLEREAVARQARTDSAARGAAASAGRRLTETVASYRSPGPGQYDDPRAQRQARSQEGSQTNLRSQFE